MKNSKLAAYFRKCACQYKRIWHEYYPGPCGHLDESNLRMLEVAAIERQTDILEYIAKNGIKVTLNK